MVKELLILDKFSINLARILVPTVTKLEEYAVCFWYEKQKVKDLIVFGQFQRNFYSASINILNVNNNLVFRFVYETIFTETINQIHHSHKRLPTPLYNCGRRL